LVFKFRFNLKKLDNLTATGTSYFKNISRFSAERNLRSFSFALYPASALLLRYLAAAWRVFYKTATGTCGLIWLAAQFCARNLAALGAYRCFFRTFRNITAAWRVFYKTATVTLGLIRLTAQIAAFNLPAHRAKLDSLGSTCCTLAGLFTAVAQQGNSN
jgi:hypothetical protein